MIKPGIYDISNEDYHNNPEYQSLSKGGLSDLLKSPAHFRVNMTAENAPTPAMIFGSAFHSLILEPEKGEVVVAPDINKRTKAGKEEWAEFQEENQNRIVISPTDHEEIMNMKMSLEAHDTAYGILTKQGHTEESVFWENPLHGFLCKCRPDKRVPSLSALVDLKTCVDASPKEFSRACANFGYDMQAAWYLHGINIAQDETKYTSFIFIAIEKKPPYAVAVYNADQLFLDTGRNKINGKRGFDIIKPSLIDLYAECLKTDNWPCYPDEVQDLSLPAWAA